MNTGTGTHENEDSISIFLPALDHLVVLFLCGSGVHGEEWSRAVTEVGFSMRWLRWCWPSPGAIDFIYIYEPGGDRSKQQVTHTCVVPSLEVLMSHLRHQKTIEEILICGPDETWQALPSHWAETRAFGSHVILSHSLSLRRIVGEDGRRSPTAIRPHASRR